MKTILTINVGSSSIKFQLFAIEHQAADAVVRGTIKNIGQSEAVFSVLRSEDKPWEEKLAAGNHDDAIKHLAAWLQKNIATPVDYICHRMVHGGPKHFEPQVITDELLKDLSQCVSFAPEHLPNALSAIKTMQLLYDKVTQVVCFDTAFHARLPQIARTIPLPRNITNDTIRKYGFHGLSYQYIYSRLQSMYPDISRQRVIVAHLGNGASMVAIRDGVSCDTTMGFTPAGGLMMSSRTGDIDPGVLIYLMNEMAYTAEDLNEIINHQSGLKGVSGISGDMKDLMQKESTDVRAREAIEMFCYLAKKHLGALIAILGGVDVLVFTGGIGEAASSIRHAICNNMQFAGIHIDEEANKQNALRISSSASKVLIHVMQTNEEQVMAEHAIRLLTKTQKN
jgi:acetate kinase